MCDKGLGFFHERHNWDNRHSLKEVRDELPALCQRFLPESDHHAQEFVLVFQEIHHGLSRNKEASSL